MVCAPNIIFRSVRRRWFRCRWRPIISSSSRCFLLCVYLSIVDYRHWFLPSRWCRFSFLCRNIFISCARLFQIRFSIFDGSRKYWLFQPPFPSSLIDCFQRWFSLRLFHFQFRIFLSIAGCGFFFFFFFRSGNARLFLRVAITDWCRFFFFVPYRFSPPLRFIAR